MFTLVSGLRGRATGLPTRIEYVAGAAVYTVQAQLLHIQNCTNFEMSNKRPFGVVALTMLFVIGTVASFISAISLTFPGSFLEPIWRLNPHAREGFEGMGHWSIVLMTIVCVACACTANGLWRLRSWGYWLAVSMLILNLVGDVINVLSGAEPRAIVGIPIVLFLLAYLMRKRTRDHFKLSTA